MIDPLTVALSELAGVLEVASADADSSAD